MLRRSPRQKGRRRVNGFLQRSKRWLREPLLHFLLIGIAVFAVYAYMQRGRSGIKPSRKIVLSLGGLRQMDMYFESQWHCQPTPAEFQAMVEDRVPAERADH